jgi:formylglycine-generating enzyme required for sulfatase activity
MIPEPAPAPEMIELPGGEFLMGAGPEDKFAGDTERPAHRVRVAPFALGRFAVTVGEFRAFRPGHAPQDAPALPVVHVSWDEARAYTRWLTAAHARPFRLPGEAEWEYACRAGTATPFSSGSDLSLEQANYLYSETGERIGPGKRTPCGQYPPNALGFCDLHGNVCEWVEDLWHPHYFGAPADGRPWRESAPPGRRVVRGGAWDYLPRLLRSAWRDGVSGDSRRDNLGFRLAASGL